MAYGSPDRLEDVPAYYEDIRGGRPVRQELVDDLVDRYRRLGIGDSPSRRSTRDGGTRAALEQELGLPVYTGMKHWHPRIPEAVERALAQGADDLVGLVLAPHYSRLSIGDYRRRLERGPRRARPPRLRRQLARRPRPGRLPRRPRPRHEGTRRLHRPQPPGAHPRRGRPLRTGAADDGAPRRRRGAARPVVVLLPERVRDRRAVARARHPRPPHCAPRPTGRRRPRLPDRLRRRPSGDPLGHRRRGGREGARARHRSSQGSRCRTPTRRSSPFSRGSSPTPSPSSRHRREPGRDQRRAPDARLPRLSPAGPHAQGSPPHPQPPEADRRAARSTTSRSTSSPARPSG